MKTLIRSVLFNAGALWITSQIAKGIIFASGLETLFMAALVLGAVNLFVKPVINLLLLPINILTLGMFRWLVNVGALYAVTLIVPGFIISGFHFGGYEVGVISLPALDLSGILGFIAASFLLSFLIGLFHWIIK